MTYPAGRLCLAAVTALGACAAEPPRLVTGHPYQDAASAPPGFEAVGTEAPLPGSGVVATIDAKPVRTQGGKLVFVNPRTGRRYVYAGDLARYQRERLMASERRPATERR